MIRQICHIAKLCISVVNIDFNNLVRYRVYIYALLVYQHVAMSVFLGVERLQFDLHVKAKFHFKVRHILNWLLIFCSTIWGRDKGFFYIRFTLLLKNKLNQLYQSSVIRNSVTRDTITPILDSAIIQGIRSIYVIYTNKT